MESGQDGWSHSATYGIDEWQLGSPDWGNVHSGTKCWGTDLNVSGPGDDDEYEINTNQWLKTPTIDLTYTPNAKLNFWHKLQTETGYDKAYVEISVNGGSWTGLASYNSSVGNKNKWIQQTINLNSYAGNNIAIRFRMQSDEDINYKGWYLDDVNVSCT